MLPLMRFLGWLALGLLAADFTSAMKGAHELRCIMYLTGQHNIVPSMDLVAEITHVNLAFMQSHIFNVDETPDEFPLFTSVNEVRSLFKPGTKISVAIGGWGDDKGFEEAARDDSSRQRWAKQVKAMVDKTGADGVDIDWEYPGGNRDDYRQIPNSERVWEIEAFVSLLQQLRATLGMDKLISIAVPGLERDLMAFTSLTIPRIIQEVDFINVMTYDLMNRRDATVQHHSGVASSLASLKRYMARGVPPVQLNLGLGYYVKWYMTKQCEEDGIIGCPTQLLEDPATGADLGRTSAFSWHDQVPAELTDSFARAKAMGKYFEDGSYGFWDSSENRWWSFDTPEVIAHKFKHIIQPQALGGVFAWGLGEDAPAFEHLKSTVDGVAALRKDRNMFRDEL